MIYSYSTNGSAYFRFLHIARNQSDWNVAVTYTGSHLSAVYLTTYIAALAELTTYSDGMILNSRGKQ